MPSIPKDEKWSPLLRSFFFINVLYYTDYRERMFDATNANEFTKASVIIKHLHL